MYIYMCVYIYIYIYGELVGVSGKLVALKCLVYDAGYPQAGVLVLQQYLLLLVLGRSGRESGGDGEREGGRALQGGEEFGR